MFEPIGNTPPDLYAGLGLRYWLLKWLPDPPPDVRQVVVLAELLALTELVEEGDLKQSMRGLLGGRLVERVNEVVKRTE